MSKLYHMCVDVRGLLRHSDREMRRDLKWIKKDGGEPFASVHELRNELFNELAKGHEVIKMGECDNFDWKEGCQGHEVAE